MFYRPPLLEEPCAQTLSGMNGKHHPLSACFFVKSQIFMSTPCQSQIVLKSESFMMKSCKMSWNHVKSSNFIVNLWLNHVESPYFLAFWVKSLESQELNVVNDLGRSALHEAASLGAHQVTFRWFQPRKMEVWPAKTVTLLVIHGFSLMIYGDL